MRPIEALQIYASGCDHHDTETALLSTRSGTGDPNPNPGDGPTELGTLLQHLKDVREVAVLNSESLTKAIAKYDERALSRRARQLTAEPNGTHAPIASEIRATVRDPANANDGDPLDRATISPPPPSGGVPAGADESWVLSPGGSDAEVLSLSTELLPLLFASGITQAETNLTEMVCDRASVQQSVFCYRLPPSLPPSLCVDDFAILLARTASSPRMPGRSRWSGQS